MKKVKLSDKALQILNEPCDPGVIRHMKEPVREFVSPACLKLIKNNEMRELALADFKKKFIFLEEIERVLAEKWDLFVSDFEKKTTNTTVELDNDVFDEDKFNADAAEFDRNFESQRSQFSREWEVAMASRNLERVRELTGKAQCLKKLKNSRPVESDPRYHSKEKVQIPISGSEALKLIKDANEALNAEIETRKAACKAGWIKYNSVKDIPQRDWDIYCAIYKAKGGSDTAMREFFKDIRVITDASDIYTIAKILGSFGKYDSSAEYNKAVEESFDRYYNEHPADTSSQCNETVRMRLERESFEAVYPKIRTKNLEHACNMFRYYMDAFKYELHTDEAIDATNKILEAI